MEIRSCAKINLGLEIQWKRPDGYHEIRTLFQAIDLCDVLEFSPEKENRIFLEGDDPSIPWDEANLVFRAARLLKNRRRVRGGVRIRVQKKIPAGSGLGGGSGNAAATLLALNIMWDLGIRKAELMELGKNIGADVPFFLEGGLCLGLERGDNIVPLPDLPCLPLVLALPSFPVSTSKIYKAWRPALTSGDKDSKIIQFLHDRDFGCLENQLEETIFSYYPQLSDYKRLFQSEGAALSSVSGTGSAVFGIFLDREKARRGWEAARKATPSLLIETLSRRRYRNRMSAGV